MSPREPIGNRGHFSECGAVLAYQHGDRGFRIDCDKVRLEVITRWQVDDIDLKKFAEFLKNNVNAGRARSGGHVKFHQCVSPCCPWRMRVRALCSGTLHANVVSARQKGVIARTQGLVAFQTKTISTEQTAGMSFDLKKEWPLSEVSELLGSVQDGRSWRLEVMSDGIAQLNDLTVLREAALHCFLRSGNKARISWGQGLRAIRLYARSLNRSCGTIIQRSRDRKQ